MRCEDPMRSARPAVQSGPMTRRLFTPAAALSLAIIVWLSAGFVRAHSWGYAELAHVGVWHAWIDVENAGVVRLANFDPLSSSLSQSSTVFLRAPLWCVVGPPAALVIAWGAFTLRRLRSRHEGRGFAVEPASRASTGED
jgi:hypothetical protein